MTSYFPKCVLATQKSLIKMWKMANAVSTVINQTHPGAFENNYHYCPDRNNHRVENIKLGGFTLKVQSIPIQIYNQKIYRTPSIAKFSNYILTHISTHISAHTHKRTHTHTYTYTHTHTLSKFSSYLLTHIGTSTHICMYTSTLTYIHLTMQSAHIYQQIKYQHWKCFTRNILVAL